MVIGRDGLSCVRCWACHRIVTWWRTGYMQRVDLDEDLMALTPAGDYGWSCSSFIFDGTSVSSIKGGSIFPEMDEPQYTICQECIHRYVRGEGEQRFICESKGDKVMCEDCPAKYICETT